MKIGVLALQGAFIEHIAMLRSLGVEAVPVRLPNGLEGLDGLIIPGGESTTMGKLLITSGLLEPLRRTIDAGTPVYGTCAGMILLARDIGSAAQTTLGEMDIVVKRNAFGRQLDSFEQDIAMPVLGDVLFHAVFIRAPAIERVGPAARELGRLDDGTIVAARQGALLATAFHPELSGDARIHAYFVAMCAARQDAATSDHRPSTIDHRLSTIDYQSED
jgi:5'-phosphate synthase pdxT subunit